jgi:hypothetical protein
MALSRFCFALLGISVLLSLVPFLVPLGDHLGRRVRQPTLACHSVMTSLISAAPATAWPPPCPAPAELIEAFQGPGGSMPIFAKEFCLAQRYEGATERVLDWSEGFIRSYCLGVANGSEVGTYTAGVIAEVRNGLEVIGAGAHGAAPSLSGTSGMVLGSEFPWVECLALNLGADTVWTFEYGAIRSSHPRVKAPPYKAMARAYAEGKQAQVDWIVSFSSLEHSGLGRYGDALNPEADAEAMQQAWCMLKPGGVMLLGVPMTCQDRGFVEFNAHRVYGFQRLAHVAKGFEVLGWTSLSTDACKPAPPPVLDPGTRSYPTQHIVLLRKPKGPGAREASAQDFADAAEHFRALATSLGGRLASVTSTALPLLLENW